MRLKDAVVLVVDDEPALLEIFKTWFELEGSRVITATDGSKGLELAATNHVDLVLTDIRMPVLDGIGLAKRLRGRLDEYLPKIIFISGFGDIDEREACDLGVEATLPKPIRRHDLISVGRRCLMDSDERWKDTPGNGYRQNLNAVFESLLVARRQARLAFGHGGFCAHTTAGVTTIGEPIGLKLDFEADGRALSGRGVVRWMAGTENQVGIEIAYIDDDVNRAWVVQATKDSGTGAFIPRTSISKLGIDQPSV